MSIHYISVINEYVPKSTNIYFDVARLVGIKLRVVFIINKSGVLLFSEIYIFDADLVWRMQSIKD